MKNKSQAGMMFVGLVLSLAVLAVLYFVVSRKYFGPSLPQDQETQKALAGQGIDPTSTNYSSILQKTHQAADQAGQANKQLEDPALQLE